MQKSDLVRLRHMLDAACEAASFVVGRTREDLDTDRMLVLSLVKSIEIIGEAASRVSAECKAELPAIQWQDIISMRNRLIHAYFDIDLDIVWSSGTEEMPVLIVALAEALSREG